MHEHIRKWDAHQIFIQTNITTEGGMLNKSTYSFTKIQNLLQREQRDFLVKALYCQVLTYGPFELMEGEAEKRPHP